MKGMEGIELVIKIPKAYYELVIKKCKDPVLLNAFKNSTPLPKGRGRLIDENKLLENLKESANHHANNSREESLLYRDRVIVREQPTIIEADETESEAAK